jgi:hypothetical protein
LMSGKDTKASQGRSPCGQTFQEERRSNELDEIHPIIDGDEHKYRHR